MQRVLGEPRNHHLDVDYDIVLRTRAHRPTAAPRRPEGGAPEALVALGHEAREHVPEGRAPGTTLLCEPKG